MHTKEPWIVTGSDRVKYIESRISKGMLQEIASCLPVNEDHGNNEANARRIVACVNACAGIPTETLEKAATSIPVKSSRNGYLDMKQQRDELLAALKDVRNSLGKESDAGDSIVDTLWHTETETIFDFLDSIIEKYDA